MWLAVAASFAQGQGLPNEETFIGGGTQPGPDGLWAPGTNTGNGTVTPPTAQPIRFQVFPATLTLRAAAEVNRAEGPKVIVADMPVRRLANLALGRAPHTPLASHEIIAIAIGNNTPAAVRLIVFDRRTATELALIAQTQKLDLAKGNNREVGLLKFIVIPGGGGTDTMKGGSFQLASQTFPAGRMIRLLAHGNGELQFLKYGVTENAVLTSVTLRVGAKAVGQFDL